MDTPKQASEPTRAYQIYPLKFSIGKNHGLEKVFEPQVEIVFRSGVPEIFTQETKRDQVAQNHQNDTK